jgi:cell division protein FtsA
MNSIDNNSQSAVKISFSAPEKVNVYRAPVVEMTPEVVEAPEVEMEVEKEVELELPKQPESTEAKIRKSFFDKYVDKIKEFLDNAE